MSGENNNGTSKCCNSGANSQKSRRPNHMRFHPKAVMKKQDAINETTTTGCPDDVLETTIRLNKTFTVNIETAQPRKPMSVIINNPIHLPVNVNNATGGGSVANLNNLTVNNNNNNNNYHLTSRKSVIGRLERSSFQTQRLSDVGVAFGQQITAKMGLKLPASQERIVEQTRWLYLRYVFVKLRQNTLPLRDLNLTKTSRARRAAALGEIPALNLNSAPATAGIDPVSIPPSAKVGRKRTAMSGSIDPQELSFLAARIQAVNLKNDTLSNHSNNGSDEVASGLNNNNNNNNGTKKFIMDPTINNQVFAVILKVIRELRELRPEFYGDTIYELIGIDKFSSIQNLLDVQMTICQEMTRSEISWCRIIALFSLFGSISLDCVRLGTPEHVGPILDGFIGFVERDLALWISQQGGWEAFLYKHRTGYHFWHLTTRVITIGLPLIVWIILIMIYWKA